jgi:hypothetical protein
MDAPMGTSQAAAQAGERAQRCEAPSDVRGRGESSSCKAGTPRGQLKEQIQGPTLIAYEVTRHDPHAGGTITKWGAGAGQPGPKCACTRGGPARGSCEARCARGKRTRPQRRRGQAAHGSRQRPCAAVAIAPRTLTNMEAALAELDVYLQRQPPDADGRVSDSTASACRTATHASRSTCAASGQPRRGTGSPRGKWWAPPSP